MVTQFKYWNVVLRKTEHASEVYSLWRADDPMYLPWIRNSYIPWNEQREKQRSTTGELSY